MILWFAVPFVASLVFFRVVIGRFDKYERKFTQAPCMSIGTWGGFIVAGACLGLISFMMRDSILQGAAAQENHYQLRQFEVDQTGMPITLEKSLDTFVKGSLEYGHCKYWVTARFTAGTDTLEDVSYQLKDLSFVFLDPNDYEQWLDPECDEE